MRFYIIFTFLFIVGFGVFVYSIDPQAYAFNLGSYSFNFPIAVWLMGVLGMFAFFHGFFYSSTISATKSAYTTKKGILTNCSNKSCPKTPKRLF